MTRLLPLLFWLTVGYSKVDGPSTLELKSSLCMQLHRASTEADALRRIAVYELNKAADFLELVLKLQRGEELSEAQQFKVGSAERGQWRYVWQHAERGGASCEASERVHQLFMGSLREALRLGVLTATQQQAKDLEQPEAVSRPPCHSTVVHSQFTSTYHEDIVAPVLTWVDERSSRYESLLRMCE